MVKRHQPVFNKRKTGRLWGTYTDKLIDFVVVQVRILF